MGYDGGERAEDVGNNQALWESTLSKRPGVICLKFISYNQYLMIILAISLSGLLGSLYVSEILNIPPCDLCWWQRIFMFTMPIIAFLSFLIEDRNSIYYLQTFSTIGFAIATYQYIIQTIGVKSPFCSSNVDCTTVHFEFLGFITLPFLSACAFLAMVLAGFFIKEDSENKTVES